jgi:O-antigen/teichoic acid export membrane protein
MAQLKAFFERIRRVMRFEPHDSSTEHGRSKERYRRMALGSLATFGARAISLLTSLVSVPLTYRYLGAEQYGIWMVLVSFITAMGVADLGIGNGVMNTISEASGKDDRKMMSEYASSGFFLMLLIGMVLAVAGMVAYPLIPWVRVFNVKSPAVAREGARAFLVLYSWFVVNIPLSVIHRVQSGLQRSYWSQTLYGCGNLLSFLGLIAVIEMHGSLPWLVFASTFGVILATFANGLMLFRSHPWLFPDWNAFQSATAKRIFKLGVLFFVMQCTVALGFTSDNIVITQVMGAAAVAIYSVPQKLFGFSSQLINIGIMPIWPAYGEAISRGDYEWVRKAFRHSMLLALTISCILCTVLAITGPWIIRIAVGRSLHVPLALFWVLALWGIIWSAWAPIALLLYGAGSLKTLASTLSIASLVNLGFSILLTRQFGVMGVCLGSIISQVLICFPVSAYLLQKLFRSMSNGTVNQNIGISAPLTPIG